MSPPSHPLSSLSNLNQALERLDAAASLDESLSSLIDAGPGFRYVTQADDTRLLFLSPKCESLFPPSFLKLVGERGRWEQLISAEDRKRYLDTLERVRNEKREQIVAYRLVTSKSGGIIPVEDTISPIFARQGDVAGYLGNTRDNSLEIHSMDTLVKQSWKELSATMTRRFLHDFNNTIAGVYSLSELYSVPGSDSESMVEAMGHIRKNSQRAQSITQRIRSLITMEEGEESYFDLEGLLDEQREFLAALLPKGTDLDLQLSGSSMTIRVDPNRFKQALFHLAANASDATGDSPIIQIRCKLEAADGDESPQGLIEVQDNGDGIPKRIREKIFEPFFTTRDKKRHAGMGLFIVKEFAERLKGSIHLDSEPNQGTTASLRIPLVDLSDSIDEPRTDPKPAAPLAQDATPKPAPTLLIYTWEDVARHPLINAIRDKNWNFRIHLDPFQLMLDIREFGNRLDGLLIFKSPLDEKAEPLMQELAKLDPQPRIALITLGESVDALPEFVKSTCSFVSPGTAKPTSLLKKLSGLLA